MLLSVVVATARGGRVMARWNLLVKLIGIIVGTALWSFSASAE
jgi:hypothetical protein